MDSFFKSSLNVLQHYLFRVLVFWPHHRWDLSSPDWKANSVNHCSARDVLPVRSFFFFWLEDDCFIALQCCVGFCHTSTWINHKYTYISPLLTEKALAPHSSTLAWKIPGTEEPGRLQSMGPLRVGHDWATSLSLFIFMHWSRKWQPIPVFLPGESQAWGSLVGCRLWGRTELDTIEAT